MDYHLTISNPGSSSPLKLHGCSLRQQEPTQTASANYSKMLGVLDDIQALHDLYSSISNIQELGALAHVARSLKGSGNSEELRDYIRNANAFVELVEQKCGTLPRAIDADDAQVYKKDAEDDVDRNASPEPILDIKPTNGNSSCLTQSSSKEEAPSKAIQMHSKSYAKMCTTHLNVQARHKDNAICMSLQLQA